MTPSAETLFVGLYGVNGVGRTAPGTLDPLDGNDVTGLYLYDLKLDPRMVGLAGKIVVDWGTGYRSWVQRAHKKNKEIMEIRRVFLQAEFPGFLDFETSLSKVAELPSTWVQILSNAKGIYLLTCPRTKEMYVGSATGEGGFQARWEQHALKGGDAVKFKSKDPSDNRVVLLEVAGSDATVHDIQLTKQRWIRKLQSIPMGLNEGPGVKPV